MFMHQREIKKKKREKQQKKKNDIHSAMFPISE